MSQSDKSLTDIAQDYFLFKKRFQFRTSVPVDTCADRIGGLPFVEGNARYITEVVPTQRGYRFDIWASNKRQREPEKARVIGHGTITQRGGETFVEGEVHFGLNRMLTLTILTVLMSFWTFSMLVIPYGFIYMFYTGGLPIIAPIYLFWQIWKARNRMVDEIKSAVTPHLSDRNIGRLRDQQPQSDFDAFFEDDAQFRQSRRS